MDITHPLHPANPLSPLNPNGIYRSLYESPSTQPASGGDVLVGIGIALGTMVVVFALCALFNRK